MNKPQSIIGSFIAASAIFLGVAYAQGPACDHAGSGAMKHSSSHGPMGDPAARAEQRLSALKGELNITAQQEPLWQAFADKTKTESGKGMAMRAKDVKDQATLPAPEKMSQMQAHMKEHLAAMESINESFKRLYAALTPEQKAAADKHFSHAGAMAEKGEKDKKGSSSSKGSDKAESRQSSKG